jgi:hypothetical protein
MVLKNSFNKDQSITSSSNKIGYVHIIDKGLVEELVPFYIYDRIN